MWTVGQSLFLPTTFFKLNNPRDSVEVPELSQKPAEKIRSDAEEALMNHLFMKRIDELKKWIELTPWKEIQSL